MGCSLKDHNPLTSLGEKTTSELIEVFGSIEIREVATNMENTGKIQGFSRRFLEEMAQTLGKAKKWKSFNNVIALLIYGIMMFPNLEDIMDFPTISVFLVKIHVHALLAYMYYSFHIRHEKKIGVIVC